MTGKVEHVDSLDDPRIAAYRNLKDRELARMGDRYIVEAEQVVRRFLESDYPVESVLLADRRVAEIAPIVPDGIPVFAVSDPLMQQVIGFKFHSGVLACGRRKPASSLDQAMSRIGPRAMMMILPETANTDNLGSLMRIAAAFGVDAMLLGPQCCDPFYRQSIRVSMGSVFKLNLIQSSDLLRDLSRLKSEWGFELASAVLDESAEALDQAVRPDRLGLLFGNEAQGLCESILQACDRRITIPMKLGTDSLNVAVAAAVFLFHFGR